MPRVTLNDGRWIDLRPMYISDRLAMVDAGERFRSAAEPSQLDYLTEIGQLVGGAIEDKSWNGALLEMTGDDLLSVTVQWGKGTEDEAVPLASDETSESPSPDSSSAEPTANPSE